MRVLPALAAALALALCSTAVIAAPGGQVLNGKQQFIDINGAPIVGGAVYIYQVGTTTPVATWRDANLSVANSNPIILDGRGQASIWAPGGTYREVVYDGAGNLIWDQTTTVPSLTARTFSWTGDATGGPTTFDGSANVATVLSLGSGVVTNAKAAAMPAATLKGNNGAASASPQDLTVAQVSALVAASGAQVAAGTDAAHLVTPASLVAAGQSISANGYLTLAGGLIVQWGHYDSGSNSGWNGATHAVTFPIAFPNGCFSVQAMTDNQGATVSPAYALQAVSSCSTTGISFATVGYQSGAINAIRGFYWVVIGD
jgi:hypothetical protein